MTVLTSSNSTVYLTYEEAAGREPDRVETPSALQGVEAVAVVGGDWVGCHVASLLLARGLQVLIIEPRHRLGYDMWDQPGAVLRERVINHPSTVGVYLQSTVEAIAAGQVSI